MPKRRQSVCHSCRRSLWLLPVLLLLVCAAGCMSVKPEVLSLTPEKLADRQLQTRVFDTSDEAEVLSASSAVLQDLGFLMDESEEKLGLLVGSKTRDAREAGEMILMITLAILARSDPIYGETQLMRISLVTTPQLTGAHHGIAVRVTFQRIVYDNRGQVFKQQTIGTPEIYQEFFAKLSKALFLEGQEL